MLLLMLLLWPAPGGWEWFTVRGACAVPVHFSVGGYTPRRLPRLPTLTAGKMPRPSHAAQYYNTNNNNNIYIYHLRVTYNIIILYYIIIHHPEWRARTHPNLTRRVFHGGHNIFTIPPPSPPPQPDEPAERRKRAPGLGAVHERTHSRSHAAQEDLTRAP